MRALKIAWIIYNNNIQGVDEIKNIGKKKVFVSSKNYNDANSFVCSFILSSHNLTARISLHQVTHIGDKFQQTEPQISQCNPTDFRPVSPTVVKAGQINKKKCLESNTVWEPTGTVVLSFLGQFLPKHIYCFKMPVPVETYITNHTVSQMLQIWPCS